MLVSCLVSLRQGLTGRHLAYYATEDDPDPSASTFPMLRSEQASLCLALVCMAPLVEKTLGSIPGTT